MAILQNQSAGQGRSMDISWERSRKDKENEGLRDKTYPLKFIECFEFQILHSNWTRVIKTNIHE